MEAGSLIRARMRKRSDAWSSQSRPAAEGSKPPHSLTSKDHPQGPRRAMQVSSTSTWRAMAHTRREERVTAMKAAKEDLLNNK